MGRLVSFEDAFNYNERKIARFEQGNVWIDTAAIGDGVKPFETAIKHPDYADDGDMIIVEAYDTREEAEAGHQRWIETMTADELPAVLVDVCNANFVALMTGGQRTEYPRRIK